MNLTGEQKQGIANGKAVALTVKRTECVVLRKDIYDPWSALLDNDALGMQSLLADIDPEDPENLSRYEGAS